MVAHLLWEQRVAGSNPVTPTKKLAPEEVEAAARSVTRLESWDIAIASGQPRVTARFTAVDDAEARATHRQILSSVREIAEVPRARLAAVVRGRSHYLAP